MVIIASDQEERSNLRGIEKTKDGEIASLLRASQ